MNYFLCHWHARGSRDHTVIKCGRLAVETWLQVWLTSVGIGCPDEIAGQLETLDEDCGLLYVPAQIRWTGDNHTYSITEITDLGALSVTGMDAVAAKVRTARNWLNSASFPTRESERALGALDAALYLLGAPVDG